RLRRNRERSAIRYGPARAAADPARSREGRARHHHLDRGAAGRSVLAAVTKARAPGAEHYREIADNLRQVAGACQFPTAPREILHLAARFETRADHLGIDDHDALGMKRSLERNPTFGSLQPFLQQSVTSGPAEVDPVLRAPLPQSPVLGLVRKIVP